MNQLGKISLKVGRSLQLINPFDIIYLKAENIYCHVYLTNQETLFVSNTLSEVASMLNYPNFIKPHRSYIINCNYIERFVKADLLIYLKHYKEPVPVSRNVKKEIQLLFSNN